MSTFTYPGKERLPQRFRRFAGGVIFTALLVALVVAVKPLIDDKTFAALLSLTHLSKDTLEELRANPWAGLLVFIPLSWLVSKWVAVEVLEFHLFPWFDEETLRPVAEKTGLLRWIDFEDSPAHAASSRLRAWLSEGVHDGAWLFGWVLRGRPALRERAFCYALLLGPNGIGKSQMVREAAREKTGGRRASTRRRALTRPGVALKRWSRRVLPRLARLADDPWHAGEIVPLGDWAERLKVWRPSAPTVLILDDVNGAMVREAIDVLDKNSGQFWYSVKLVIVDQFVPSKLELEPIGRGRRDHLGREIPIFPVPDLRWSGAQAGRAFSGGVWIMDAATGEMRFDPAHDISEFWQAQKLEWLSRALDGNPLMLAEAAVWLAARNARGRPYRTVDALLSLPDPESFEREVFDGRVSIDYRAAIAHRILGERLDEVFASHLAWARDVAIDETALVEALCCASLAGGAALSAFEIFNRVQGPRLEKWIVRDLGGSALLPPVGSWPIAEAFIERGLDDYRALRFEAIVGRALAVNPIGLARQLTRKGRLARRLFEEIARLEADAGASAFALNLFEVAAARAIWADREAAPRALAALEKLPLADLPRAQADLETLGAYNGRVPDVLVAAMLLTALGARRFAGTADWDWSAWETFHPLWTRWLRRVGDNLDFAPPAFRDAMKTASGHLYDAFFVAAGKLDDPDHAFKRLADALECALNWTLLEAIPLRDEPPSWAAVFRRLFLLKGISWNEKAIAADLEAARRRADAMAVAARHGLPSGADPRQRAYVETFILARRVKLETEAGGTVGDLEAIVAEIDALSSRLPDDPYLVRRRLYARSYVARRLKETKDDESVAWAQAEAAEAICKPFLSDEFCVEALIWCCAYVLGAARAVDNDAPGGLLSRLRAYAQAFPDKIIITVALAKAISLRIEVLATIGAGETKEAGLLALASEMEREARGAPDSVDMQWCRIVVCKQLADHWAADDKHGHKIRAIAQETDDFTRPFPDHVGLQSNRLGIWTSLALYESRHGVSPGEAERIARGITWSAEPFRSDESVSATVAVAWECAAFGWHRDLRAWTSCERALRRLQAWVADNRSGVNGASTELSAWGSLLIVHRKRRDFVAFARLEPEALDRAGAARTTYSDNENIAELVGFVFAAVAHARNERTADRASVEEMAARIRLLAAQFPNSESLPKNAAFVDRLLHGRTADTDATSRANGSINLSVTERDARGLDLPSDRRS